MSQIGLQQLFQKKLNKLWIALIIVVVIISLLMAVIIYRDYYISDVKKIISNLEFFLGEINQSFLLIENYYNTQMERFFNNIYTAQQNGADEEMLIKQIEYWENDLIKLNLDGLNIEKINYYFIDQKGVITATDYQKDFGLDLSEFDNLWQDLLALDNGEVLLRPLDNESSTGRTRLYSYLKLADGSYFELGILFENYYPKLQTQINELTGGYQASLNLYSSDFMEMYGTKQTVTEAEKVLFNKSLDTEQLLSQNRSFFEKDFYFAYNGRTGTRYIKLSLVNNRIKRYLYILFTFLLAVAFVILYLKDNFSLVIKNLIEPITIISEKMEVFDPGDSKEINIQRSKIKEIDQIRCSFLEMVDEIQASYEQMTAYNQEIELVNKKLKSSYIEVENLSTNLERMISLITNLGRTESINEDDFLTQLLKTAARVVPETDYGSIYLYEEKYVRFVHTIGHNKEKLNQVKLPKHKFISENHQIEIVKHIEETSLEGFEKEKRDIFMEATKPIQATLSFDLYMENVAVFGISLDIANESSKQFSSNAIKTISSFKEIASSFYLLRKYKSLQKQFTRDIILSITKMLEIHDQYTKGHSESVADLSEKIALELGLSVEMGEKAYWAGLVHDIGKINIPDYILNKKAELTNKEYDIIKKHPSWGYETLKSSEELDEIAKYVLYHHERWDGAGYPFGLARKEIPLISQIIMAADAWDAMTTTRSYRKALDKEEAIRELKDNIGSQFSPKVAKALLRVIDK